MAWYSDVAFWSAFGSLTTALATILLTIATFKLVRATNALEERARIDQERQRAEFEIRGLEPQTHALPLEVGKEFEYSFWVHNKGLRPSGVGRVSYIVKDAAGGSHTIEAHKVTRFGRTDDPRANDIEVPAGGPLRVRAFFKTPAHVAHNGVTAVVLRVEPVLGEPVEAPIWGG